jgi:hypothetical protein
MRVPPRRPLGGRAGAVGAEEKRSGKRRAIRLIKKSRDVERERDVYY